VSNEIFSSAVAYCLLSTLTQHRWKTSVTVWPALCDAIAAITVLNLCERSARVTAIISMPPRDRSCDRDPAQSIKSRMRTPALCEHKVPPFQRLTTIYVVPGCPVRSHAHLVLDIEHDLLLPTLHHVALVLGLAGEHICRCADQRVPFGDAALAAALPLASTSATLMPPLPSSSSARPRGFFSSTVYLLHPGGACSTMRCTSEILTVRCRSVALCIS
jgi:hypothetical protein